MKSDNFGQMHNNVTKVIGQDIPLLRVNYSKKASEAINQQRLKREILSIIVSREGIEPTTHALKGRCSTI